MLDRIFGQGLGHQFWTILSFIWVLFIKSNGGVSIPVSNTMAGPILKAFLCSFILSHACSVKKKNGLSYGICSACWSVAVSSHYNERKFNDTAWRSSRSRRTGLTLNTTLLILLRIYLLLESMLVLLHGLNSKMVDLEKIKNLKHHSLYLI